ncbi:hypothetical protein HYS97_01635 [Candidatus Daviesbacteria bacterium]|nr:hypothetical protein [Candidatus Daviesbacteria bacterium]
MPQVPERPGWIQSVRSVVGRLQEDITNPSPRVTRRFFLRTAVIGSTLLGLNAVFPKAARAEDPPNLPKPDASETPNDEKAKLEREIKEEYRVKIYTMREKFPPGHTIWQRDKGFIPYPSELTIKDLTDLRDDLAGTSKKYSRPKEGQVLEIIASNRNSFYGRERNQLELCFIEGSPFGPRMNAVVVAHELVGHRWVPQLHYSENGGAISSPWFDKTFDLFGLQPAEDIYGRPRPRQDKIDLLQKLLEPLNRKVGLPPNLHSLSSGELIQYKLLKRLEYGYIARYPEELIAVADEIWFMGREYFEKVFTQVLGPEDYPKWLGFIKNDNFGGESFATKPIEMLAHKWAPAGCCDGLAA